MSNKQKTNKPRNRKGGKKVVIKDTKLDQNARRIVRHATDQVPAYQKEMFRDFMHPLVDKEHALLEYSMTLADPTTKMPSGVPFDLGPTLQRNEIAQISMSGTATANSSGFCFVAACPDGWLGAEGGYALGAAPATAKYAGYTTQGTPVWYSNSSYVATTTPADGATTATTGLLSVALGGKLDAGIAAGTEYRFISGCLEVWSTTPAQTAQGEIIVCSSNDPGSDGSLMSKGFSDLEAAEPENVSTSVHSMPNWGSAKKVRAIMIPYDQEAYVSKRMESAGSTTFKVPSVACVASGFASGQTLQFKVTYNYEYTKPAGYRIGMICGRPMAEVSQGELSSVGNKLRPYSVHSSNGKTKEILGPAAWLNTIAETNPPRAQGIWNTIKEGASNLISSAAPLAKQGISSLLSKIPKVGPALATGFNWLFGGN